MKNNLRGLLALSLTVLLNLSVANSQPELTPSVPTSEPGSGPIYNPPLQNGEVAPGLVPGWDNSQLADLPKFQPPPASYFEDEQNKIANAREVNDGVKTVYEFPDGRTTEFSWSRAGTSLKSERKLSQEQQKVAEILEQNFVITGTTATVTVSQTTAISRPGYEYVPSIIFEGGVYKIWFCSNNAASTDNIWYATATDIANASTYSIRSTPVYIPTASNPATCTLSSGFDCAHTCDPSVVKVKGTYYMYYTGFPVPQSPDGRTKIGVLQSADGIAWSDIPALGHNPVILPSSSQILDYGGTHFGLYGAGQPSVTYSGDKFYLTFHDDTTPYSIAAMLAQPDYATAANFWLGAGPGPGLIKSQFAIRSSDPTFQTGVEEVDQNGTWTSLANYTQPSRSSPYLDYTVSADWTYSPRTKEFLISIDGKPNHNSTRFFESTLGTEDRDLLEASPAPYLDGPGIARFANGQMLRSPNCDNFWFHVLQNKGPDTFNNDLFHIGWAFPTAYANCFLDYLNFHDYDGDGASDEVVYRPSDGNFYINSASTGVMPEAPATDRYKVILMVMAPPTTA